MNDWKRAFRRLLARPGFSAIVVLTLAVGIAANATVRAWLESYVWQPLPGVVRQDELVVLVSNQGGGNVSELDLRDFAGLDEVFEGALFSQTTFASLEVDENPEWVNTQIVSASFFDVLGVRPRLGRTFQADEDRKPGGNPVLVISERLWRRSFASDPGIVGRVVQLNRHSFTVIGVVPGPFRGTMSAISYDAWAPSSMIWEVRNQRLESRSARGWHNLARLRPGVGIEQARAAVANRNAQLARAYPDTNRDAKHRLVPLSECPYGGQAVLGPVLQLLQVVGLTVLLIVAVNVANLSLASASARRKEIAIQLSLGAGRARLVRMLAAESLLLALAGGTLGALLATRATGSLALFLPSAPPGVVLDVPLGVPTLAFTLLLTVATGLVIGLVTAWRATSLELHETLKQGGRSSSVGHQRLRNTLVVAEIALALVLLVGAGLCLQGLRKARQLELGLDPDNVLTASLQIGMNGYTPETGLGFYRELRQRLARIPGVEEAALASWFPLGPLGLQGLLRQRRGLPAAARGGSHLRVRDRVPALPRHAAHPARRRPRLQRRRRPVLRAGGDRESRLRGALLAGPGRSRPALPHARAVAAGGRRDGDRAGTTGSTRASGPSITCRSSRAFPSSTSAWPCARPATLPRWWPRCATPCASSTRPWSRCACCRCAATSRVSSSRSAWPPGCCCC